MGKSGKDSEETEKLHKEIAELKNQLKETRESFEKIQSGHIDALVIANEKNLKILTERTTDKIYRVLIEKMHEGAVTINEDGIILYCNSCFAGMLKLPLEKVIGNPFKDFLDSSYHKDFDKLLARDWNNAIKQELNLFADDGKTIPVLISVNILPIEFQEDTEKTFALSIIVTDLTIIKKNQEELKTQKELLEEAEKIAEIGSWVVDLTTNKLTLSNELFRIYGLDPETSPLNLSPFELIHQKDPELSKVIFNTSVREKKSFDIYTKINIPHDSREKILHIKGKVICKDGKAFQLIGTTQDVTIQIEAEQELRENNKQLTEAQKKITKLNEELEYKVIARTRELEQAYERLQEFNYELEEINKSKDKFISVISHDLRNPVSANISSSEIMLQNFEDLQQDDIKNFSRIINSSSKKIVEQLNELVEWSKQKSKKINYNPEPLNLYDFLIFSLELIQPIADQKQILIVNNIEPQIKVKADSLLLRSIFQNLITNSIKFTPEGGEIIIGAYKESLLCIGVTIKDSGIGMTEEIRESLFSDEAIMTQLDIKNQKSKGLGLILVRDFVEKHQGKIWVESKPGKGTTVFFTLPSSD
jgi:PAS domain S-box-containing protein